MSYFIMALIVWLVGKRFFVYYPQAKDIDLTVQFSVTCFCLAALPCGIIQCCTDFDKDEEEKGIKKVTLTVTNRNEGRYHIYLRFSDGYTLSAAKPNTWYPDIEWYLVQIGDSVQKLMYPSGECEYTPVFDEDSHE